MVWGYCCGDGGTEGEDGFKGGGGGTVFEDYAEGLCGLRNQLSLGRKWREGEEGRERGKGVMRERKAAGLRESGRAVQQGWEETLLRR